MLVEEVMTKNVVSIDCNETVFNACKRYGEHQVGCLVVMDNKIIVGIITERDTIERIILANRDPKTTKVREIMSQNIKTIHSLAPLQKAAQTMRENDIKKLPVILNNEIVGIITVTDISRAISAFSDMLSKLTESYETNRKTIENIMDEWGAILNSLNHYRELRKK